MWKTFSSVNFNYKNLNIQSFNLYISISVNLQVNQIEKLFSFKINGFSLSEVLFPWLSEDILLFLVGFTWNKKEGKEKDKSM